MSALNRPRIRGRTRRRCGRLSGLVRGARRSPGEALIRATRDRREASAAIAALSRADAPKAVSKGEVAGSIPASPHSPRRRSVTSGLLIAGSPAVIGRSARGWTASASVPAVRPQSRDCRSGYRRRSDRWLLASYTRGHAMGRDWRPDQRASPARRRISSPRAWTLDPCPRRVGCRHSLNTRR